MPRNVHAALAATFAVAGCQSPPAARPPVAPLARLAVEAEAEAEAEAESSPSTFSISAVDPRTGDAGVAVASRFFAVGSVVPWVDASAGAVATQSFANTTYGSRGLDLLRGGASPQAAVDSLTGSDPQAALRQVGIASARGEAATFTGADCRPWAGGRTGAGYAVQGNLLVGPGVVDAMARAFEASRGELAGRLLAALEAGEAAGGDARGRQSAALHVARRGGGYGGQDDRYIRIHVDDHPRPIAELGRLLEVRLGRDAVTQATKLAEGGGRGDAVKLLDDALVRYPGWDEAAFARAGVLLGAGREAEGRAALEAAVSREPGCAHYHLRAGLLLAAARLPGDAVRELEKAVALNGAYRDVIRREATRGDGSLAAIAAETLKSLTESTAKE